MRKLDIVLDTLFICAILAQAAFVGLRLAGVINWQWWVVFMPTLCVASLFVPAFYFAWRIWRNSRRGGK